MNFRIVMAVALGVGGVSAPSFHERSADAEEKLREFIWGANGHPFAQEGYRPDTEYFIYELLDEPYFLRQNPGTAEAHYGLAKLVRGPNNRGWRVGPRKRAFHVVGETIESLR
jgi:hypothetical protein